MLSSLILLLMLTPSSIDVDEPVELEDRARLLYFCIRDERRNTWTS